MSIAPGQDTTRSSTGRSGVTQLLAELGVHVAEPERLQAEARVFDVDGVRLADWRSSPMSMRRPPTAGPVEGAVTVLLIASGRIRYSTGDTTFEGGPGSLHLLTSEDRIDVDLLDASRVLAIRLPRAQLPTRLWGDRPMRSGVIVPSALTPGFIALLGSLLGPRDVEAPGLHRVIALRAVATAVLTEQLPPEAGDMDVLRHQMMLHIELHLADADLGPRTIAEAFDVSLRWVHMVFHAGGLTVAGFIRESRVDAVAEAVRSDLRLIRASSLAAAHGFASRDQLNRAFRARYGITVHEYQAIASDGGALPSPGRPGETAASADEHEFQGTWS